MRLSLPPIEAKPIDTGPIDTKRAPPAEVAGRLHRYDWVRYDWASTPGKLKIAQVVLVLGVLLAGGVGVYATIARADTARDIAERLEPLNANVTTLYRSLADADATVAAGYLSGGVEPEEIRSRYGRDVVAATAALAQASAQAEGEVVSAKRIADITTQLPQYAGLVERARANNRQGFAVGVSYLRRASELMQSSILPEAAEVQQRQAAQLDDAYRRAGSVPVVALVACAVSLVGLIWAQVFLFQRTHRVVNVGLAVASGAVIIGLVWWVVAGAVSARSLAAALGHSRSVSEALAPAQIAALQARALESLKLIDRNGDDTELDFEARMQRLAHNDGAGGALGAAMQFATDQQGRALVGAAIDAERDYARAHQEVRRRDDLGNYGGAVDAAIKPGQDSAATAFDRLAARLRAAVDYERGAFGTDIERARRWLTGLPISTGALAAVSALGVALGVRQRLEEYR